MKIIAAVVLLLVAVAFAQPHTPASTLSLSTDAVFANARSDFQDSFLVGCDVNVHPVNSIQTNTDLRASVLTIRIENNGGGNEDLLVELYDSEGKRVAPTENRTPSPSTIDAASLSNDSFVCDANDDCVVDYFCDSFVSGNYEIWISHANTVTEVNNYTVTFTEWTETADNLGVGFEGSFVENDAVSREFISSPTIDVDSVPGPRTHRHYFVDLARDLPQFGFHSTLKIRVVDWFDDMGFNITDGDVSICYSTTYFVGATDTTTSLNSASESPCGDVCEEFDLGNEIAQIELAGCDVPADRLWIGIRTPQNTGTPARYTIEIIFVDRTEYPVTTITEDSFTLDSYLAEHDDSLCEPSRGRFTCEDYYEMSLSSIGANANSYDGVTGPWFVAHIHAIANGDLFFTVHDDEFGGPKSQCPNAVPRYTCGGDSNNINENSGDNGPGPFDFWPGAPLTEGDDCYVYIPPCYWYDAADPDQEIDFAARNWVTTVVGHTLDADEDRIFYGLDFEILSMPTTTVQLAASMGPWFSSVRTGFYQHYALTLTAADISDASKLEVELYARHEDHDLALFWQYGSHAGFTEDCLSYRGRCETREDTTGYYTPYDYFTRHNYCRFAFFPCDNPAESFTTSDPRQVNDSLFWRGSTPSQDFGIRVDDLRPGTYYFSVHALTAPLDADSYDYESQYTMSMSFTGAVELEWDMPLLQHVFLNEYSSHFYVDMPNDDDASVQGVEISISDVQNFIDIGEVHFSWNCDELAGNCPCYTNIEDHAFNHIDDHHHVYYIPKCSCPGRVYFSVENQAIFGAINKTAMIPVGFTASATVVRSVTTTSTNIFDTDLVEDFEVPRDTWGKVSSTIAPVFEEAACRACLNYKFYHFVFNSLQAGDAFVTRLEFVPTIEDATPEAWLFVISNFDVTLRQDEGCRNTNEFDGRIQACRARANLNDPWLGRPEEEWSFCQLVFEPCTAVVSADDACYDSDNLFDDTSIQARQFDQTREWYAAVQSVDEASAILFSLYAQVRSQVATSLSNGVAIQAQVFEGTYNHYSIQVSGSSSARSLIFEFYSILDQDGAITFFINRGTFAGLEQDCLTSIHEELGLCNVCHLQGDSGDANDALSCSYQIRPCDLTDTTYFVSAYSGEQLHSHDHSHEHAFFDNRYYYTISAHIQEPEELLLDQGHPVTGHLWEWDDDDNTVHSTNYYVVNVPSNINEERLSIALNGVIDGTIFVSISQEDPATFCRCPRTGHQMFPGDSFIWTRDYCDLVGGERYYIVVDAITDSNNSPATFSLHAELTPYTIVPVTLVTRSDNNDPVFVAPVVQYYVSNTDLQFVPLPSPRFPLRLHWNGFTAFEWTVSATVGRSMNIRFWQNTNETAQTLDWYLSTELPIATPSTNDFGALGPLNIDGTCTGNLVDANSGTYNSLNGAQKIHISPCALESTTYYLTFSGESFQVNSRVDNIDLKIVLVDALAILEVPSAVDTPAVTDSAEFTDLFESINTGNEVEFNINGDRYFRTRSSISVDAGEVLTFSWSGSGTTIHVSFEDVPCNNVVCTDSNTCEFFACDSISGDWWVLIEGANSATSFTIEITSNPTVDSNLSVDTVEVLEDGETPSTFTGFGADEWRWHRLSHDGAEDAARRFDYSGSPSELYISTTGSPVIRPDLIDNGDNSWIAIFDDSVGSGFGVNPPNCGAVRWTPNVDASCCYGDLDIVFAVADSPSDYEVSLIVRDFVSGTSSTSSNIGNTDTVGFAANGDAFARRAVQYYTMTIGDDSHGFAYVFSSEDTAIGGAGFDLYVNVGSPAGSAGSANCPSFSDNQVEADSDPAICHTEASFSPSDASCSISAGGSTCAGFVPICAGCLYPGAEVVFAVTSDFEGIAEFSLAVSQLSGVSSVSLSVGGSDSVSGSFPPALDDYEVILDATTGSCDALYDHFEIDVNAFYDDFLSDAAYFPDWDTAPDVDDRYKFQISLKNVRQTSNDGTFTQTRATNEVEWFINFGSGLAGTGCCYAGSQVGNSFCDDYIVTEVSTEVFDFDCILDASTVLAAAGSCSTAGESVWTASVGRGATPSSDVFPTFSYTLSTSFIDQLNVTDEFNLGVSITPSNSQVTPGGVPSSFTSISSTSSFRVGGENEVTWFSVSTAALEPTDYLRVWLQFTEEDLNIGGDPEQNDFSDFNSFTFEPFVGYWTDGSAVELQWQEDRDGSFQSYDGSDARSDCGDITFDANGEYICSVQFAPRDLAQFNEFNELIWFRYDRGNSFATPYSFGVFAERRTLNVQVGTLNSHNEFLSDSVRFTSDIVDREWQFYRINIADNNGLYRDFSIGVDSVTCGTGLEVYSTFSGVTDVMRPGRVPTPAQHVATGSSFSINDACLIDGGNYWIGVWAPEDFQTFPDPINVPSSNTDVVRPGTYRVTASLTEWAQKTLDPECWYSAAAEDFIPRLHIPVEAENRGSQWVIEISYDAPAGDFDTWSFHASRNNFPFDRTVCNWDQSQTGSTPVPYTDDTLHDYMCEPNGASSCRISIPLCEFESANWYFYLDSVTDFDPETVITVKSWLDRKHIPVAYLDPSFTQHDINSPYYVKWTGQLIDTSYYGSGWQYFKAFVNADANRKGHFKAELNIESCDAGECDLEMFVVRGPVGHANDFITFQEFSTGNCPIDSADQGFFVKGAYDCNCHDFYDGTSVRLSGDRIVDSLEFAEHDQYFIGVAQHTDTHCVFSVEVSVQEEVELIAPHELVCDEVNCVNYYEVDLSGFDTRFIDSVFVSVNSTTGDDLRLAIDTRRIPYFLGLDGTPDFEDDTIFTISSQDVDIGVATTVNVNAGCGAPIDHVFIAVQNVNADLDACDSCTDAIDFQLKVWVSDINGENYTINAVNSNGFLNDNSTGIFYNGNVGCGIFCGDALEAGSEVLALSDSAIVTSLSSVNEIDASSSVSFNDFESGFLRLSYTPSADVTSFQLFIDNFDSGCGLRPDDLSYSVVQGSSASLSCTSACGGLSFSDDGCAGGSSSSFTCFSEETFYIDISVCASTRCGVSFDISLEETTVDATQIGAAHTADFLTFAFDRTCDSTTQRYYVDVAAGQPLSVQIREPFGGYDVEAVLTLSRECTTIDECTIYDNGDSAPYDGTTSDCRVDSLSEGAFSRYGCAAPGRYYVDVTVSSLSQEYDYFGYELSAWNQWVQLSSSATDELFGADRHFYSFANNGAAKLVLEVQNGPSVRFSVTDDVCNSGGFQYHQVCAFGRCQVDISTEALNSGADTFYVVLTSDDITSGRHENIVSTKATPYVLSLATGSSACASRPSSGFCGASATDIDLAFGSAAWDSASGSSTWDYEYPEQRDNMAYWKYLSMIDGLCPTPPDNCKRWLRRIACADAFPTCDASGFLQGTCRDACYEVECECGAWLENVPRPEFSCLSARYQPEQTGTCFVIPDRTPPPPPPPANVTVNPLDTCDVHIATLDAGLISTRATGCTAADVEGLLFARSGGVAVRGQFNVNEISGNEISVTFFGSNAESAVSLCTRMVNIVTVERDGSLVGTCLEDAVAQIEENSQLAEFVSPVPIYEAPTSVVDPPSDIVITIPGSVSVPSGFTVPSGGFTIPDLISSSPASAFVPSIVVALAAFFALFF